jgi:hypothetical protein
MQVCASRIGLLVFAVSLSWGMTVGKATAAGNSPLSACQTISSDSNNCCNVVSNSTAQSNAGNGIVSNDCCNAVDGSKALKNGRDGINLTDGNNLVNRSRANKNSGDGIALDRGVTDGGEDFVVGSKAVHNGGKGITLTGTFTISGVTRSDNGVIRSTANKNHVDGVSITCPGNILKFTATGNGTANLDVPNGTCNQL